MWAENIRKKLKSFPRLSLSSLDRCQRQLQVKKSFSSRRVYVVKMKSELYNLSGGGVESKTTMMSWIMMVEMTINFVSSSCVVVVFIKRTWDNKWLKWLHWKWKGNRDYVWNNFLHHFTLRLVLWYFINARVYACALKFLIISSLETWDCLSCSMKSHRSS